jgi:outer membrane translocation and assembly module TamA
MNRSKSFILVVAALFLVAVISISAQGQTPEAGQKGPPPGTPKAAPYAKPYPMGFVTIEITSVGAGVGMEWGKGVLTYKGKQYTFKVRGIQIATVGISKASVKGEVYNIAALGDFPGQYAAMTAGAAVFKGKTGQAYENTKGVQILLSGTQEGLNLNIGPEGFYIQMEKAL